MGLKIGNKEPKEPKAKKVKEPKAPKEKKAKAPKEKPSKEKPAKASKEKPSKDEKAPKKFTNPFKKNAPEQDDGMDILTDVKEPFSFSGFFETHVVERAKRFKTLLADKGILFFLLSPFQARGRLIAELLILCIGVMFGVIPRASSLVGALQDQAYASEISGLSAKTVGSITLTPAASSNYKGVHMIAFVVEGKNLPSDPAKYEVHLARSYGASDWADVTYSWTMYPVTDTKRILLISIDQTKQASGYGAFKLYIQLEGEEVKDYMREPFEITLSRAQETRDLYDKNGIHLSALTEAICGTGEIAKKQADFEEALEKYRVAVEQAEKMPVDIRVTPTPDKLETYCLANRLYRALDDYSTTEDILSIEAVDEIPKLEYDLVLTSGGIDYDSDLVSELTNNGSYSEEEKLILDAFERVETAEKAVLAAMTNVNTAARSWYSTLQSYKLILNQTIKTKSFPLYAKCTATIDDPIEFVDAEPDDSDDEEGGLHGTMTGDEDYTKPLPSGDDQVETEDPTPIETEEPDDDGDGEDTEEPDDDDGEDSEEPDEDDGEDTDGEDTDGEDADGEDTDDEDGDGEDTDGNKTDTDADSNKTGQGSSTGSSDNKGTGSGATSTPDPADSK